MLKLFKIKRYIHIAKLEISLNFEYISHLYSQFFILKFLAIFKRIVRIFRKMIKI